jgi:hypothetical protein
MGTVYEAEDSEHGRRVALKLIAADRISSRESVERFRQEGRLASNLSHPRCVFVLAADEDQGRPYIIMELMPGETLQTLVESRGPLPASEAIAKIFDVIEGLQEAHLQGVIHRDVKPSNCFLEADGRVKVGDFGLSKSLDSSAALTRTGSFVGTPLYASPEQIKRNATVDAQTDVYSVAATLYYILTGRPPHLADDAAATLARIVSEAPPSLRTHRPELSPALDAVVLRGLERDRDRRWQDLARFREALLPFVSTPLVLGDLPLRVTAYLADIMLCSAAHWAIISSVALEATPHDPRQAFTFLVRYVCMVLVLKRLMCVAYFSVLEGIWGATLGKRLMRLRVRLVAGGGPPGFVPAFIRALVFFAVTNVPGDVTTVLLFSMLPTKMAALYEPVTLVISALGYVALAATMRAGNGYRGLHELASKTRVGRLPLGPRRRAPRGRRLPSGPDRARALATGQAGVLQSVGPFRVRGAIRWEVERRVLLGEDSTLERPVWIVLRPKGSPSPPQVRRDLTRPSRPRWLRGGEQAEGRWDAYAAPMGCPLADFAGPAGLPWADARPILHDLVDELAKACAEGTLPDALSVDQVWIQPDGTVQLVDPLGPPASSGSAHPGPLGEGERALDLLRRTSALALEGGRIRAGRSAPTSIAAAVPEHAARMLDRLLGQPRQGDVAYSNLAELAADLEADRDKPTEVNAIRRAMHLGPLALALLGPLAWLFLFVAYPKGPEWPFAWLIVSIIALLWVIWAGLTHGGLLYRLVGVGVVRRDSRPAERWRCAARSLIAWLPITMLLIAACLARTNSQVELSWTLWGLAAAALVAYAILALVFPARSLHDRLAGTWLVPR